VLIVMLAIGSVGWLTAHHITAHSHHVPAAHDPDRSGSHASACSHDHAHRDAEPIDATERHSDSETPGDSSSHDCPLCHLIAGATATLGPPAPLAILSCARVHRPTVDPPALDDHLPHLGARAPPLC